jgi:toxin secretion/phage lysis holin
MLTGLIAGAMEKKLDSAVCFKGVGKKLLILLVVALGHILDAYVFGAAFCKVMAEGFYIANEGLSILENTGKFVPYPKKMRDVLKQLKSENDDEQEGKTDENS